MIPKSSSFEVGGLAPDFTSVNPDGEKISLSDFRGHYVILDFWTSCIKDRELCWSHASNIGNDLNPKLYNISAIPAMSGIDPAGKIVAKGLRGDDLVSFLSGALQLQLHYFL